MTSTIDSGDRRALEGSYVPIRGLNVIKPWQPPDIRSTNVETDPDDGIDGSATETTEFQRKEPSYSEPPGVLHDVDRMGKTESQLLP